MFGNSPLIALSVGDGQMLGRCFWKLAAKILLVILFKHPAPDFPAVDDCPDVSQEYSVLSPLLQFLECHTVCIILASFCLILLLDPPEVILFKFSEVLKVDLSMSDINHVLPGTALALEEQPTVDASARADDLIHSAEETIDVNTLIPERREAVR